MEYWSKGLELLEKVYLQQKAILTQIALDFDWKVSGEMFFNTPIIQHSSIPGLGFRELLL